MILQQWDLEVEYNQKLLMDLTIELDNAGFGSDEELLKATFKTIG